jgi:transposase
LPAERYAFAEWKTVRVNIDYHIEVAGHYYSVPHALVKKTLEARIGEHTVECFHRGERVASHPGLQLKGRHTTLAEHMPEAHRQYAQWTPERIIRWAEKTGPATATLILSILQRRAHPQQGFRSAPGILRLGRGFGDERLEAACRRALHIGSYSYKSIESILRQGLDRQMPAAPTQVELPIAHENIRGAGYYH